MGGVSLTDMFLYQQKDGSFMKQWKSPKMRASKRTVSKKSLDSKHTPKNVEGLLKQFLTEEGLPTDGITMYTAEEWADRGEGVAHGAYAVAVIEGTSLDPILNFHLYGEKASAMFDKFVDFMDARDIGWEPATSWAIAFYKW